MEDQLGVRINSSQEECAKLERSVMNRNKRTRRYPVALSASYGFGLLEQLPKTRRSAIAPGMCSGESLWRHSVDAYKD